MRRTIRRNSLSFQQNIQLENEFRELPQNKLQVYVIM